MKMIEMPMKFRTMDVVPATLDDKNRTVMVSLGSGAPVLRYDWWEGEQYYEELSMDPAHVRMGRMESGRAPFCREHNTYSLDGQIGVIREAKLGAELMCKVAFSRRPEVEPVYQDVKDGICSNTSVGYRVYRYQDVTPDGNKIKVLRAIDWEPFEGSLVPVGADAGAGVRSQSAQKFPCEILETRAHSAQGDNMPPVNPTAAPAAETRTVATEAPAAAAAAAVTPPAVDTSQAAATAADAERARASGIMQAVRKAGLPAELAEQMVSRGITLDAARAEIIDKISERTADTAVRPHVVAVDGAIHSQRMASAERALLHRSNPQLFKLEGDARDFRGMSMLEFARHFLEARGVSTRGMSKMELAGRALESSSDLPSLLANVANKSLRAGYEAAAVTYKPWCRQGVAPDFKTLSRVQLSDFPTLESVSEGGEFKRGAMTDGKETYAIATSGKILVISRQALINDDTDAFSRIPQLAGTAAADFENSTVYAILTANAALADTVALFHATHKNVAGSGTALDVTNVGKARKAMRQQKNLAGRPISLLPKFLLVSSNDETAAEQVVNPIVPNAASSVNPFVGKYQTIVEPLLDVSSGAQPWYVAADPSRIDTIEYSYLEGQEGVYMENRIGFDVDGIELKVRLDFAAKALDYRGLYKNPGT